MGENSGVVQSLDRAMRLLEVLADADDGCRLVEVARRAELPVSTTHRLLLTLENRRFAQFDRGSGLWTVGARCLSVGASFLRRRALAAQVLPYMDALSRETGRTVNFGTAAEGSVVFVTHVENASSHRFTARPGGRSPLHCSGIGKSMLAGLPEASVRDLLTRYGMKRLTPHSMTEPDRLCDSLEVVRQRGYALDDQENTIGLRCIASAIYGEFGQPVAAISIAGSATQIGDASIVELGQLVASAAAAITAATGGQHPGLLR
jgi:IclR family transcriptional regulator, acetate operon repressor